MPRRSRCSFYGKPWRQYLVSSQCGLSTPDCEPMAKTVASAVKPGGQAMRSVNRAFLLVHPCRVLCLCFGRLRGAVRRLHIYRDNGGVLHGWPRCAGRVDFINRPARVSRSDQLAPDHFLMRGPTPWRGLLLEPGENGTPARKRSRMWPQRPAFPQVACPILSFIGSMFLFFFSQQNVRRT